MNKTHLRNQIYNHLLELSTDHGINASANSGVYGCVFGRDSALTILKLVRACEKQPNEELLNISRKGLLTLVSLQGKEINIESGEEPGKFIHEFRTTGIERVTVINDSNRDWLKKPWYVYPDNTLKNYDSIDSTPLTLIALYKYWQLTRDSEFLLMVLPAIEAGLNWIITYGDIDKDFLLEYELKEERTHGGLPVQSWTDSHECLQKVDGSMPKYPIAPVEAQGYAWLALRLWGDFYSDKSPVYAQKLLSQAKHLKQEFNKQFVYEDEGFYFAGQALDGDKYLISTVTGNPLILLWATYQTGGVRECIIEDKYIQDFVKRGMLEDLFDPEAGIRTMSTKSPTFSEENNSYHNGSFWPILNGLVHEGFEIWEFNIEAEQLKAASLKPLFYFNSPIELYVRSATGEYLEFKNNGQTGCRVQAWSAAATLDFLT